MRLGSDNRRHAPSRHLNQSDQRSRLRVPGAINPLAPAKDLSDIILRVLAGTAETSAVSLDPRYLHKNPANGTPLRC